MSEERDERPRPLYGEYAPEGPSNDSDEQPPENTRATESSSLSPQLDGVPHNLGIGASRAGTPPVTATPPAGPPVSHPSTSQPPASTSGAPTAGPPPGQDPASEQFRQPAPAAFQGTAATAPTSNRIADRIVTIVLLVFGALGALNFGTAMLSLGTQLHMFANIAGIENFTVPPAVGTLQTVGAIAILSIYAITLIWSIQRMRARRIAFWVPLSGGVLAFITTMIVAMIAVSFAPELITNITPEQLMQIMQEQVTTPAN